jgi:excisionase family DNA binding protein
MSDGLHTDLAAALAALEAGIGNLDPAEAPAVVTRLAAALAIAGARLPAWSAGSLVVSRPADLATPTTLDVPAAARFLGISPTALRRLVAAGTIAHVRVGRRLLFRRATLDQFAADRERFGNERS